MKASDEISISITILGGIDRRPKRGFFSNIEMIVCKRNVKNRSCYSTPKSVERDYESGKKRRWRLTDSAFIDRTLSLSTDLILVRICLSTEDLKNIKYPPCYFKGAGHSSIPVLFIFTKRDMTGQEKTAQPKWILCQGE